MAKLSISKAWDESKRIIGENGSLLVTIALALFVLPGVISDVVSPGTPAGELPKLGYWTAIGAIAFLISLVGQLAVIRLAVGSRQTVGEAIGHGARRAPSYVAATIVWFIPFMLIGWWLVQGLRGRPEEASPITALGLLLLVVVMLFVGVRMMMTAPVASSENIGPLAILRRSWDMTRGHWLRLFGFLVLIMVAMLVMIAAVGAVMGVLATAAFGALGPMTIGALLVSLISQLVGAAISVVFMVMLARIYVQLAGAGSAHVSVPSSAD
jgi:hypothetical protein